MSEETELIEFFVDMESWSIEAKDSDDAYNRAKAILDKCTKIVMDSGVDVEGYEPAIAGIEDA